MKDRKASSRYAANHRKAAFTYFIFASLSLEIQDKNNTGRDRTTGHDTTHGRTTKHNATRCFPCPQSPLPPKSFIRKYELRQKEKSDQSRHTAIFCTDRQTDTRNRHTACRMKGNQETQHTKPFSTTLTLVVYLLLPAASCFGSVSVCLFCALLCVA